MWVGLAALIWPGLAGGISSPVAKAQQNGRPAIASDEAGLTITWTPPGYTLSTFTAGGERYSRIEIPGLALSGRPGYPELPFYSGLIGLPPAGEAKLELVDVKTAVVTLPDLPAPALAPQPVQFSPADLDPRRAVNGGPTGRTPDPAAYGVDAFYPAVAAELTEAGQVRGRRIARLTINPLQVNPVRREMELVRFVHLRIRFSEPAAMSDLAGQSRPEPFAKALGDLLLNPEAGQWRAPRTAAGPDQDIQLQALDAQAGGGLSKVMVKEAGLYVLTYTDLQSAGLPVGSLDPRSLKLSYGYPRQEIAILVEGEADGQFNSGDRLLFYGNPRPSRYVDETVYFLSYGGGNGLRMGSRPGAPAGLPAGTAWRTATAETNKFYDPLYPARDGDRWYWDKLYLPDQNTGSYGIQLQSPLASGPAAVLKLWLQGYTSHPSQSPDHRVQLQVNGSFVGAVEWDGKTAYTATASAPAGALIGGENQVRLTLPGISGVFADGVWLDAISLTYPTSQAGPGQTRFQGEAGQKNYTLSGVGSSPLVFDISNPDVPQQLSNYSLNGSTLSLGDATAAAAAYLIAPASELKRPLAIQQASLLGDLPGGADYIIVAHSSLMNALGPLAAHRAGQGLRVTSVDVQAIYDSYGDGRMDAEAIRRFLSHAYQHWPAPAPLYVLLAGDGSYDFKNYSGHNPQTLLPPYLAPVDPWWGETASDNRLVTLAGNDNLPEMLVGRLPVSSAAEASLVVDKIIQYETNPAAGLWNGNQIFVADNPDQAGDFHAAANQTYVKAPASYSGQRYYYGGSGQSHLYSDPAMLQAQLLTAFNNGSSFVTFYGHSSWEQWAVESLLHLDNFDKLNNQNRLPVVSQMTCFTAFFHHPKTTTFDERLLRTAGGGAVAVWGSTGLGVGTGHDKLQAGFYEAMMYDGQAVLGLAIMAGKLELFGGGFHLDLLDTFSLLGDPALNLAQVFKPDLRITQAIISSGHRPGDPIKFRLTLQNTGAGPAAGVVVTDHLPAAILSPSWSTSSAGVTASGSYVWNLPDLAPGETVVIELSGLIDPALPPNFSLTNVASVTGSRAELSSSNNSSTAVVGVRRIYLPVIMNN